MLRLPFSSFIQYFLMFICFLISGACSSGHNILGIYCVLRQLCGTKSKATLYIVKYARIRVFLEWHNFMRCLWYTNCPTRCSRTLDLGFWKINKYYENHKIGWRHNPVPSPPSRNEILVTRIKNYRKSDTKVFCSCTFLLDFFNFLPLILLSCFSM